MGTITITAKVDGDDFNLQITDDTSCSGADCKRWDAERSGHLCESFQHMSAGPAADGSVVLDSVAVFYFCNECLLALVRGELGVLFESEGR